MAADLKVEKSREQLLAGTNPVRVIEHLEDEETFEGSVTTTKTVTGASGLMGEAVGADVVEIEIIPLDGAISYNPNGAAVVGTNARILQGVPYLLTGNTAKLNAAQVISFSGAAVAVSVITRQIVTG